MSLYSISKYDHIHLGLVLYLFVDFNFFKKAFQSLRF